MSRPWIFICPSSRGIGHALTRHLLRNTSVPIFATARSDPSSVKNALLSGLEDKTAADRLTIARIDVTDEGSIREAAEQAAEQFPTQGGSEAHHLHLAFAIPGVLHPEKAPGQVDYDKALETYRINALGPLMLMKHFTQFLPRKSTKFADSNGGKSTLALPPHAVWVNMSARVGSVTDNHKGGWYSYRSSKAAVNSLTKTMDHQLEARSGDGAMAIAYHPGTVRTDLSKGFWNTRQEKGGLFEVDEAVEKMADVVMNKIGVDGRGKCWDWRGEEVPP